MAGAGGVDKDVFDIQPRVLLLACSVDPQLEGLLSHWSGCSTPITHSCHRMYMLYLLEGGWGNNTS